MDPIKAARALSRTLARQRFSPPVHHVYDPTVYARGPWETYLERYAKRGVEALWLGMNPGPYGMVQTGVPFGEIAAVRDWLGIEGPVNRPKSEHPKRPIEGFACTRSEVSGRRLWGWAAERFDSPAAFFERFFVWNYCPLAFLEEGGKNRTPDKLPVEERDALYAACDEALRRVVGHLEPRMVLGIGKFAETRAKIALGEDGPRIGTILHPSPASPMANRGWAPQAERQLEALGIELG